MLRAGNVFAVARGPLVGREIDRDTAAGERRRQRLGRKQVAAGAAGRDQHERRAVACIRPRAPEQAAASPELRRAVRARGRSRVSASSMPMP